MKWNMNMKWNKKQLIWMIEALGAFFVVIVLVLLLAYQVYYRRSDAKIVRIMGSWLPAARLGSHGISYGDFIHTRDTVKTYLTSDAAKQQGFVGGLTPEIEKKATIERLLRDAALDEYATEHSITVPDEDVRAAFANMVAANSSTTPNVAEYLAKNFGWNEDDFRRNVVRPALIEEKIALSMASTTQEQLAKLEEYLDTRLAKDDVKIYLRF
jgi:hypothetical protein